MSPGLILRGAAIAAAVGAAGALVVFAAGLVSAWVMG